MTIDSEQIEAILQSKFDYGTRKKGHTTYHESEVEGVQTYDDTFSVEVEDPRSSFGYAEVNIEFNQKLHITGIDCDCSSIRYCSHIAAALYFLLYDDYEIYGSNPSLHVVGKYSPHEWNLIAKPGGDISKQITNNEPRDSYEVYSYNEFENKLRPDNTIECRAENNSWHNRGQGLHTEVKVDEEGLKVKCHSCNSSNSLLCIHTYATLLLLNRNNDFPKYLNGDYSYERLSAYFADLEGFSQKAIEEDFEIIFGEKVFLLPLKKHIQLSSGLKTLTSRYSKRLKSDRLSSEDVLGTRDQLENYGGGLWWTVAAGDEYLVRNVPFAGKYNKSRTLLKSNFQEIPDYTYFSKEQKRFLDGYEKLVIDSDHLPREIKTSKALKYLVPQVDILNSCHNYYGIHEEVKSGNYSRSEKLKKAALYPMQFHANAINIELEIKDESDSLYRMQYNVTVGGKPYKTGAVDAIGPLFMLTKDYDAYLFNRALDGTILYEVVRSPYITFSKKNIGEILPFLNQIRTFYPLVMNISEPLPSELLYGGKKELYFSDLGQYIVIKPYINFDNKFKQNVLTRQVEDSAEDVLFDIKGDDAGAFQDELSEMHENFQQVDDDLNFYSIHVEDFLANNWFFEFFEKCKRLDIEVFGTDLLENFKFNRNKAVISSVVSSGIDWFETKVDINFGKLTVPMKGWVEMVRNNQKYIKLSDGTLGVVPEEWLARLKALYEVGEVDKGEIKISKYNFSIVDEYFGELSDEKAQVEIARKREAFRNYSSIKKHKKPALIQAELRDYQLQGYRWLRFLDEFSFGGCLADDMGLGKTLQMLCLLAYKKSKKQCFALVVVPNSLIFNWANEIEKFCPSLRYLIHHGPNRKFASIQKKKYDLVVTTYGTAASDIAELKEVVFDTIILDESQAIKNPNSKRYKAMRVLNAEHRYVMTGTPIENNTFDLFAQFNFINPGLVGNANSFRNKFAVPIDSRGDKDAKDLLRKMINPFILRRTKEQVAADLPEKTESVLVCEMGTKQKKYYDSVRNDIKNSLNKTIQTEGMGKVKFQILEGLLRLRQIANSPLLVDKKANSDSVKIDTLLDHIMANNTHKCLVFSQFVGMLGLIRERLDEMQVRYAYLDGSTKNRQEQVDKFQTDRTCQVFLISIKAGNTGLNLTAADYVYIVDPWWNPAVEAQAIDRTHRIGQVNHVFAYKLVCKDTIEEKILLLQSKKKELAGDIITTDEGVLKSLDKNDLLGLFE